MACVNALHDSSWIHCIDFAIVRGRGSISYDYKQGSDSKVCYSIFGPQRVNEKTQHGITTRCSIPDVIENIQQTVISNTLSLYFIIAISNRVSLVWWPYKVSHLTLLPVWESWSISKQVAKSPIKFIIIPPYQFGTNSENYHFVNHLCAYLRYNNIPKLFTFLS